VKLVIGGRPREVKGAIRSALHGGFRWTGPVFLLVGGLVNPFEQFRELQIERVGQRL
jgi:hypothetical protein